MLWHVIVLKYNKVDDDFLKMCGDLGAQTILLLLRGLIQTKFQIWFDNSGVSWQKQGCDEEIRMSMIYYSQILPIYHPLDLAAPPYLQLFCKLHCSWWDFNIWPASLIKHPSLLAFGGQSWSQVTNHIVNFSGWCHTCPSFNGHSNHCISIYSSVFTFSKFHRNVSDMYRSNDFNKYHE